MKLALFISSLGSGGAERVISDLANHWTQCGHDVHLITFASRDEIPFYPLDEKITIHPLNLLAETLSIFKRFVNIINRLIVIRRTVKFLKPDRILSFVDITNITVLMATLGLKIPVVVSERIDPHFHNISNLYKRLRLFFYPKADKIIAQTRNAADYFDLKNKMIIQNIVPMPLHKKSAWGSMINIICVGRLSLQKNHDWLIRVFEKVGFLPPNTSLTIYGEGPERANLERLIRQLKLEDRIFLPGAVKNIQEKLAEADLFIFPSRYEGFPNALCEAMAVGLPVIASNCTGNIDVVEDGCNGLLFPIGNEEALINHMKILCDDAGLREKLGKKAMEISDTYSPEKIYRLWDETVIKLTEFNKF
ncbi:MAG: glycosyltransferase family 4 protein [Candidatus Paracaedibacteraceae bacterium]|nr:glycosyltransferase family 4 protein [Candidatus Paracaedibacteraceae bacterium]